MKTEVRFRTQFNEKYKGSPYKNEYGPSLTVPDLNLTVKELMVRHTRGVGVGAIQREEHYLPEGMEVPSIKDFTEIEDRREELKQREKEIREEIGRQVLAKQKKEQEKLRKEQEAKEGNPSKESETD